MSRAILTLPMMPVDGNNYGKFVTPIICETLRNIYNATYYHCINLLDSFNDREQILENYMQSLEANNIEYNKVWYDKDNIDLLLDNIKKLIKNNYIHEINSSLYMCDCGIVEIEESKIPSCNQQNLKFTYNGGNLVCKCCGSICKKYHEKILVFSPYGIKREEIKFLPGFLNNDAKTYDNIVMNSYVTISRKRDTGIKLKYNNTNYNIDIDFLWATYLANFHEEEKIIVSGNRMLYQLFLIGLLEKCLNVKSNTILLGTPYLTNLKDITRDANFINDPYFRKLAILFNLKWSKKEKNYDTTILSYLKNMSSEKRKKLYDIINRQRVNFNDFYDDLEDVLKNQFNMQNCIKKLKME